MVRAMKFEQHKSPNVGSKIKLHSLIVLHYTASSNFDSTVTWLTSKQARASAHLVVGRDGRVAQLVPFDVVAWHAGASTWPNATPVNRFSIGIEMVNLGPLELKNGVYRSVATGTVVPKEDVFEGKHKNGASYQFWQKYTDVQVAKVEELIGFLKTLYPTITQVVGHDDVSPGRKQDPGPGWVRLLPRDL